MFFHEDTIRLRRDISYFLSLTRQKFDPRSYTPQDLALIERALKLMLAGRSADREPELIPPGDR